MRLIYFILWAIFISNPVFSNFDILPDFIGYLFLMKSLSKASYINEEAEELSVSARKMCIISVAKTFSLLLVSASDVTMSLLLSFSCFIVELIFGIPFIIKLFKYFSDIAVGTDNGKMADKSSIMQVFTIAVTVLRLFLALAPDLTALTLNNGIDTDAFPDLTSFRPMLFIVTGFFSTILCIVWLVIICVFMSKTVTKKACKIYNDAFYSAVGERKPLFESKNTISLLLILTVGSLFVFDASLDYVTVTPDFILTLAFLVVFAILYIKKYQKFNPLYAGICVSFVGQVVFYILSTMKTTEFYKLYKLEEIKLEPKAEKMYESLSFYSIFESVFFAISVALMLLLLYKLGKDTLEKHKEMYVGCDFSYQMTEYKKSTRINLIIVASLTAVCSVVYPVMVYLKPYQSGFVMLNYVVEILLVIFLIKAISNLSDSVFQRIYSFSRYAPQKIEHSSKE